MGVRWLDTRHCDLYNGVWYFPRNILGLSFGVQLNSLETDVLRSCFYLFWQAWSDSQCRDYSLLLRQDLPKYPRECSVTRGFPVWQMDQALFSVPCGLQAFWFESSQEAVCLALGSFPAHIQGGALTDLWSFSFSISSCNEYSGLISFRLDWLDLLAVQGSLKSFLQHHSAKASILWCSTFFIVQLSYPYMTTGKKP